MSAGNIDFELQNTEFRLASSVPVRVLNIKHRTLGKIAVLGYVSGAPASLATSLLTPNWWSGGAIVFDTYTGIAYTNAGTPSLPSWVVISKSA